MPTYNFSELSYFEFESLCRDLLQAELELTLELFGPGRDRGIDIRYVGLANGERKTIVAQCKCWNENAFDNLLSHLRNDELPKIQALKPSRYILMTSVALTPDRKDRIIAELEPWIKSPSDIFGKDDMSGLIARHQEVERRHIKLWLTSTEVLRALLNSDIATRSEAAVEDAKTQLRLWVPNESLPRVREILESTHVCVISGMPGVGKSMLANVLLAAYASEGYQPIVISADIEEGERAWSSKDRQVFHYDDFLGQITYGELDFNKNEETRLSRFMLMVTRNENKRLILTTREYVLSEALHRFDRFSPEQIARHKSVLSLSDYTEIIRAKILYNHLYFSDLDPEMKTSLVPGKKYWDVIRHKNYNPRVISHVVDLAGVGDSDPGDFVSKMLATLNSPGEVWNSIFINLPPIAQRLLVALASLPSGVLIDDVRAVVEKLCGQRLDLGEFQDTLKILEGTFISLRKADPRTDRPKRIVEIRDASVLDYVWGRLQEDVGEVDSLIQCAVFFEQCVVLYNRETPRRGALHRGGYRGLSDARQSVDVDVGSLAAKALELIDSRNPRLRRWTDDGHEYMRRDSSRLEYRAAFLVEVFAEHSSNNTVTSVVHTVLESCVLEWEKRRGASDECVYLLRQIKGIEDALPANIVPRLESALLNLITGRLHQTTDFSALLQLEVLNSSLFEPPHRSIDSWRAEFRVWLAEEKDWLLTDVDDPDVIEYEVSEIQDVAVAFGEDITDFVVAAEERVAELYEDYEPDEDTLRRLCELQLDEYDLAEWSLGRGSQETTEEVDSLFQSLL